MAIAEKHFVLFLPAKPTISSEVSLAGVWSVTAALKRQFIIKSFKMFQNDHGDLHSD